MIIKCRECDKDFDSELFYDGEENADKHLCFECERFRALLEKYKSDSYVTINGTVFLIGSVDTPKWDRGFSGRLFKIKLHTGFRFDTRDLNKIGDVPDNFKNRLPDDAEFIA